MSDALVPHCEQNFSRLIGWPQSPQNFAPGATWAPQLGQPPTTVFSNFSLVTYVASCATCRACCTAASVCAAEYSASRSGAQSKHKPRCGFQHVSSTHLAQRLHCLKS